MHSKDDAISKNGRFLQKAFHTRKHLFIFLKGPSCIIYSPAYYINLELFLFTKYCPRPTRKGTLERSLLSRYWNFKQTVLKLTTKTTGECKNFLKVFSRRLYKKKKRKINFLP